MNNYMKTIISGLKQWVSSQKSDWNQQDSSAANYVKNRTHYTESGEIKVLPKTTISSDSFILKTPLVKGSTYTVTFNDVTYECVAKYYDGYVMIGNNAVYEYDNGVETDTGEPFAIDCSNGDTDAWIYFDDTVTAAPTVSITTMGEIVHKLDKKYLPDSVVVDSDLADVAISGSYYDLPDAPDVSRVLKYSSQSLTSDQKTQARNNIGASDFSGDYNDLTNSPCNTIINRSMLFGSSASSTTWSSGSGTNTKKYTFANVNLLPGMKYEIVLRRQTTYVYTEQFTASRVTYTSISATMVTFGNASLYYNSAENTGEPVCAVYSENNSSISVYVDVDALGSTPTYIGVYKIEETVNQLDERYIPDTIARTDDLNTLIGDVPVAEQIDNAMADIEAPVQSDWNESDSTSQSHILNRVCYEDCEYTEAISGNSGTTLSNGYYFWGKVFESSPILSDSTYRIVYDGMEFALEAHECVNTNNGTGVYLGNGIILTSTVNQYTGMIDTGEPFVFHYSDSTKMLSLLTKSSGVTFVVEKQAIVLKQLDDKFIPDTIARTSKVDELSNLVGDVSVSEQIGSALVNNQSNWAQNDSTQIDYVKNRPFYSEDPVEVPVFESTTLDFNGEDSYGGDFSVYLDVELLTEAGLGVEYVVIWDGVEYRRTSFIDNYQLVVGNPAFSAGEDNGDPFLIEFRSPTTATVHVDRSNRTTHTLSITAIEINIHKIDDKYLPDNVFVGDFGEDSTSEIFNDYENNISNGHFSHAEGTRTTASGYAAHAENYETTAGGDYAHAEGNRTTATGEAAHSEGYLTDAIGNFSHSEGYGTSADSSYQHVQGKYNIKDTEGKYLHIVGNGPDYLTRKNAHTIDWDGNAWFAGDVYVGGTDQDSGEKLVKHSELPVEVTVDATLTVDGQAADAKATGDAINNLNTLVGDTAVSEQINTAVAQKSQVQIITWGADD